MSKSKGLNRIILLYNEINANNTSKIIERIYLINAEDKIKLPKDREPIIIILNSNGGYISDGLGLVGVIEKSKTPINIECVGNAMSMALLILVAAQYRTCLKFSSIMYHECSWIMETENKLQYHRYGLQEGERLMKLYDEFLISRTKLTQRILDDKKEKGIDWYITPEEALKYGIVHTIS